MKRIVTARIGQVKQELGFTRGPPYVVIQPTHMIMRLSAWREAVPLATGAKPGTFA